MCGVLAPAWPSHLGAIREKDIQHDRSHEKIAIVTAASSGLGLAVARVLLGFTDNYPVQEANAKKVPTGRYGKVQELGETIAFLLSDSAGYINGQSILVDGGLVR